MKHEPILTAVLTLSSVAAICTPPTGAQGLVASGTEARNHRPDRPQPSDGHEVQPPNRAVIVVLDANELLLPDVAITYVAADRTEGKAEHYGDGIATIDHWPGIYSLSLRDPNLGSAELTLRLPDEPRFLLPIQLDGRGARILPDFSELLPTRESVGVAAFTGPPPPNDICEEAFALAIPSTTTGSTVTASAPLPNSCIPEGTTGLWYTVTGTGTSITASMCGMPTSFDSLMSVFCGSCDDPTCVGDGDDECSVAGTSEVTWCSEAGATYFIFVGGFMNSGAFELALSENGTTCTPSVECIPRGGCCVGSGCSRATEKECLAMGGTYSGDGSACADFAVSSCGSALEPIDATGTQLFLGDDTGTVVPIDFTFDFYGTSHTDVAVCSNGYLTFGNVLTDFTNDPIPTDQTPNDFIAPLWDDLSPNQAGSVFYETLGTAPDRRFIAYWLNVTTFNEGTANTFEVVLFESDSSIEFRYGAFVPEDPLGDYTIGVEDSFGLSGQSVDASTVNPGDCLRFEPFNICPEADPCWGLSRLEARPEDDRLEVRGEASLGATFDPTAVDFCYSVMNASSSYVLYIPAGTFLEDPIVQGEFEASLEIGDASFSLNDCSWRFRIRDEVDLCGIVSRDFTVDATIGNFTPFQEIVRAERDDDEYEWRGDGPGCCPE